MSWFRRNTAIATTCWLAHYKHDPSENAWWMQPCLISRLFSALSISLGHTRKQENFMDHPCSSPKSEAWATSSPTRPLIQWCTVCEYGCKGQRPRYPVECVKDLAWCARVCNLCFHNSIGSPQSGSDIISTLSPFLCPISGILSCFSAVETISVLFNTALEWRSHEEMVPAQGQEKQIWKEAQYHLFKRII